MVGDFVLGERTGFGGQFQVMAVSGELGAVARKSHAVLEFGRGAPDLPPESFGFQQVSDGVVGLLLLQTQSGLAAAVEVAGIDEVGGGQDLGGHAYFFRAGGGAKEERREEKRSYETAQGGKWLHDATASGVCSRSTSPEFKLFARRYKTKW